MNIVPNNSNYYPPVPKTDATDAQSLGGDYNRSDLQVLGLLGKPGEEKLVKLYAMNFNPDNMRIVDDIKQFAPLEGSLWNVAELPNAVRDLVNPIEYINTEGAVENYIFQLFVRQPVAGFKRLVLDGKEVELADFGDTLIVGRYIAGGLDLHTDPSVQALKPRIIDQSFSQSVLEGTEANIFGKFLNATSYEVLFNDETNVISTLPAARVKVTEGAGVPANKTSGVYFVKGKNLYGETLSDAIFITVGEPEAVYVTSSPSGGTYDPNTSVTLEAEFGGTPAPYKTEVRSGDPAGTSQALKTLPGGTKAVYTFVATEEELPIFFRAYNKIPVTTTVPGQNGDPDTTTTEMVEQQADSDVAVVKVQKLAQDPPKNGVVDDTNNTYKWTDATGKVPTDAEYAFNGGAYSDVTTYPLPVGDINLAAGALSVRYKQTTTHSASTAITNALPYEGSLISPPTNLTFTDENPDDISTAVIGWTKSPDTLSPSTQEYSINYSGAKTWTGIADNKLVINQNIAAGDFAVREQARTGKPASAALVNTGQPFVTKFNSNFVFTGGNDLKSIAGANTVYADDVNQINVTDGKYSIIQILAGDNVNLAYYTIFQINTNFGDNRITVKSYDDNGTGNTANQINVADSPISGVKWRQIKGKAGNGTSGSGLRNFISVDTNGSTDTFVDFESPFPSSIKNGDKIRVKAALKNFSGAQQDFTVTNVFVNADNIRVVEVSGGLSRKLIGGVWSLIVS